MTYAEYKKQRLSENTTKANTSSDTNTNGSYAEYKKQRLSGNTTPTKTTQLANMPSYEEHLKVLEEKKKRNTESLISSLPVSATAVKTQIQNNDNNFKTGINPDFQNAKAETQKKAYEQIKNSGLTNNIKEYATAKNYYEETLPTEEKDNYLNYKALAERTDNPTEKAKYNVMAEKSKKHSDLYYVPTQTAKTLATSVADSAVNAVQFAKNAFKSEMQKEIKEAWNSIATFTSPDYKSKFKGLRDVSDEQANKIAQNSINSAIQILKKHNITVPDNVTSEYARKMIEDIDNWTYKENKVEEFTRKAHENVQEQNQQLGNIGKTITQTADVVGNMVPTIATNAVLPGSGMGTMFLSSAQGSTEEALREGATYDQALTRGILSGGLEVATEMIGGENIAKLTGMPTLFKKLGIDTSNKLMQVVLDVGSEGLEEMVSAGVQPIIDKMTYNPNAEFATAEDYWNSFKESILPTLVFAGVNSGVNAISNHKINNAVNNYKTKAIEKVEQSNMTVEQKAKAKFEIEKGAQKIIDEAMQNNTSKSEAETSESKKQMIEALEMQKGKISQQINELTSNNVNIPNTQNIVREFQNNARKALNLGNNMQMSISDVQNTQATLPSEIQNFVENRNKVASGLNVQLDNTLNTDGVMIKNQDGTRTIKINPNSTRAYEFVTMHEMLHDLEGTSEYQELANFVKERAITHDSFEEAKQTIIDKYTKYYQENGLDMSNLNMDVETVNDMTAQALGNQQFLNELAGKKPNVFMRIYNWVKNVLFDSQKTGKTFSERRTDNKYLNELKKKFETAYNTAYKGNGETKYSIQTDNNGNKYVKVDTDQNIFEGVETKDYPKIARMYIQDYLKSNTALGNNSTANIGNKGISKYTNPIQQTQYKNEKMKLSTELNNILAVSEKVSEGLPTKDTSKFPNWEYYKVNFEIDGKTFEGLINIGVDKNGNKHFYDINKIRITSNSHISASKSSNTDFINYSIPSTDSTVNNQYMQKNGNNTQGLENSSSFSLNKNNPSWSNYLKEYWDLMPNSTKTFGLPSAEELQSFDNEQNKKAYKSLHKFEDIADMTEDDIRNEKGVNYKHKQDKNTKNERKFFENAKTSRIINEDIKESIDVTTYERQSNAETLEKAMVKLDEQGDKLIKQWETKTKNFTAEDVAIGAILIERYQQQGDNESAVNVVQKLADMGTEVGRAVQMYSIFQRLTPEAMMIYQQRKLNDVFKEISQRKTGEWVEENRERFKLTKEDSQFITEQVEKAQQATSEREKQIELAKIEKRINDKLPPERGQTIKAIRRMAMLFNPKTQVRNVVGNALIMPVNDVADIIGTQIDKLIAKKTGVRTTNYADFKEKGNGIKKGLSEAVQDYKMGIRTEPSGSKYEFNFGGKSFNENTKSKAVNFVNNKLNGIENLLGAVMSGGDRPFYEAAFNNSLQGQMKANNVTTPTTEMIDIAVNEALSRTWNDNNSYTEAVLAVRRAMNKLNIGGFGLGDLIIPFAKTPANLTKAIVEYSPVGLVEAIYDYVDMKKAISRGEMTAMQQKKFVNSMSKAIAGSILYLIAGALAHTGAITGSADDDKDVKNFEQNVLGIQPYSIKIGDKTFTYSWANPLNAPLAIMADTYKMSRNNENWFDILTNAFKVAGEVVVDNSFLQGIKELFEADSMSEGIVDAVLDLPSQFIPTFLSQFATLFDKNKRQTFEYGDKLKTTVNQMKTKIPGLKNTLAPTVNTFGEEVENYGGDNNIFNVFLNPANVSEANATDTQKELYSLYEATKDKTIFPRQAPYYLSDNGEKINLSSEERTEYQKTSGQYVTENLGALLDSEFYKSLDNEDKVELINEVISDSDTIAKDKWIDTKTTEEVSSRNKELDEAGIPLIDYYNAWFAKKEAEGKKNYKGETISGTKKKAQKTAINEAVSDDLTASQRKQLYKILGVD